MATSPVRAGVVHSEPLADGTKIGAFARRTLAAPFEANVELLARTSQLRSLAASIADQLSMLASSVDDMNEFYRGMESILSTAFPFERLSLAIVAPNGRSYTHVYTSGEAVRGWRVGDTVHRSDSKTWRVLDLKRPVALEDNAADGRYSSLLAIPIISGGRVVAGLNLRHSDPAAYQDVQVELAHTVAESLAAPLNYLPLCVGLVKKAAHADIMAEISRLISSVSEIGDVYPHFASLVGELIECDRLSISAVEPAGGKLEVLYVEGLGSPWRTSGVARPLRGTLVGSAVERGRVIAINSSSSRIDWPGADDLAKAGLNSVMVAPMMIEGEAVGAMLVAKKDSVGYVPEDLAMAGRIASQIAGLVASELRRKELDRDVAEKEALGNLARKAGSSLDVEEVYRSVSNNLETLIPHDSFVIGSVDLAARTVTCEYSDNEYESRGTDITIDDSDFWIAMEVGYPSTYRAVDVLRGHDPITYPVGLDDAPLYSTLVIPLRQAGESVAALIVQSSECVAYDERTVELASRVGSHIGGAIANASVHRRSLELAREQAIRMEVEAENLELIGAAQARSEFLSNVSHELRTPLTAVSSLTSSLARTVNVTGTEREQTILKRVQGATERLRDVVDALLNASALEAGKGNLQWTAFDLRPVLRDLVDRFQSSAEDRAVRVDARITEADIQVYGDTLRLEQALANVLDNAVRYSERGDIVTFDVSLDADAVSVVTENGGSNLTESQVLQVTRPFYRADNLATRSEPGVGVGLAISKAIVELHEGALLIDALPEGGMRAEIRIPVRVE